MTEHVAVAVNYQGAARSCVILSNEEAQTARQLGIPVDCLLGVIAEAVYRATGNDASAKVELRNLLSTSNHFLEFPDCSLVDPVNYKGFTLAIFSTSPSLSSILLCEKIIGHLSSLSHYSPSKLEILLELLLWSCLSTRKPGSVMKSLELARDFGLFHKIATASLLTFSIERGDLAMTRMLLEYGVGPNCSNVLLPQPLMQAARLGNMFTLVSQLKEADVVFAMIVRALLTFGANPLAKSIHGTVAAHCLPMLAVTAPTVATTIITETPPDGFRALSSEFSDHQLTPLAKSFYAIAMTPSDRRINVTKIVKFSILPLIRVGAPLVFEEIFSDWLFFSGLAKWNNPVESYNLWRQLNVVARLCIEARQSSSLSALAQANFNTFQRLGFDQNSDVVNFVGVIRASFPRPLTAICRETILRHLPLGFSRYHAIDHLSIPRPLSNYLKFDDLVFE